MIWLILTLIVIAAGLYLTYKEASIHELHKMRAAFEHYLDAHPMLSEQFKSGMIEAEHIIDEEEKKETPNFIKK